MSLQLFAHPFSSYCWKVLIALWENEIAFTYRQLDPDHPENGAEWLRRWPMGKMPVLVDGDRTIVETAVIIEYLQAFHSGPVRLIPEEPAAAIESRMIERIADDYVMTPMIAIVADAMREPGNSDAEAVATARATLSKAYSWLDERLDGRQWGAGDTFTLADCAAGPALFYADWIHPVPADLPRLRGYRARLLARPSLSRCVEEARPYRSLFPPGAPDRD